MANLIETLSKLLNCRQSELADALNHPINVQRASEFLNGRQLETTYLDQNGVAKLVNFEAFSQQNSSQQMAYNGYLRISVQQHFYVRHRIRLLFPNVKCVLAYSKNGRTNGYYPCELLRLKTQPVPELHEWSKDIADEPSTSDIKGDWSSSPNLWWGKQWWMS